MLCKRSSTTGRMSAVPGHDPASRRRGRAGCGLRLGRLAVRGHPPERFSHAPTIAARFLALSDAVMLLASVVYVATIIKGR